MDSLVIKTNTTRKKELVPRKSKNGRKPIYNTEEEKLAAHKKAAKEYYQRNKDNIAKKSNEYYIKTKYLEGEDVEYHYNSKYYKQYVLNAIEI